jgi:excisionase family DNA binding protein
MMGRAPTLVEARSELFTQPVDARTFRILRHPRPARPALEFLMARPPLLDDQPSVSPVATDARPPAAPSSGPRSLDDLPPFLTVDEVADLLRTTRKAVYARAERALLPGVFRDGRRLLVDRDELLRSLSDKRAASPGGPCR